MLNQHRLTIYLWLALGLGGYLLPWILAPTAPLTLNAYDLAEWTSLHPSQFGTPLIVPLLLRIQLPIITMLAALFARGTWVRRLTALGIVLFALAQLPPLEFATIARHDSNYQQQFVLAVISFAAGLILLAYPLSRRLIPIAIGMAAVGMAASLVGQHQAQTLYYMSLQEAAPGAGLGVTVLAYGAIIASLLRFKLAQPRNGWLQ